MKKNNLTKGIFSVVLGASVLMSGAVLLSGCGKKPESDGATEIATAEQFMQIGSQEGVTKYRLTNNIDLNEVSTEAYTTNSYLIKKFAGQIDGDGYTITMPETGNNNYGTVIYNFNGTLKDVTLHFDDIDNQEINFSFYAKDEQLNTVKFEGVKTTGSIDCGGGITNYSPLINHVYFGDASFVNCTNNLDISGVRYGSAFLGGYVQNDSSDTLVDRFGNSTTRYGFAPDRKVEFINCVNNGDLFMDNASMLIGNSTRIPTRENLTIRNCVNNGSIVGTINSGLFSALHEGKTSADIPEIKHDYLVVSLPEFNDYAGENTTGTGTCITQTLSGLSLSYDETTRLISIAGPQGEDYSYTLSIGARLREGSRENEGTSRIEATIDVELGETEYGFYKIIDKTYLQTLTGATKEEISANIAFNNANGSTTPKFYKVTHTHNGVTNYYYYFDVDDADTQFYIVGGIGIWEITVTAYDTNGDVAGQYEIFRK